MQEQIFFKIRGMSWRPLSGGKNRVLNPGTLGYCKAPAHHRSSASLGPKCLIYTPSVGRSELVCYDIARACARMAHRDCPHVLEVRWCEWRVFIGVSSETHEQI